MDKSFKLVCHSMCLEDSFALYNRILNINLDKHVPVKSYNIERHYSQKWFNDNLRVMKKKRRCLEMKFMKKKTNAVWLELSQYKRNYNEALHKTRTKIL